MSHYPKVHLQFGSTLTFCGINVKPDWMTDELRRSHLQVLQPGQPRQHPSADE